MRRSGVLEESIGLSFYATDTAGIGGRIRDSPEDFRVEEIPHVPATARSDGKYTIVQLTARNWETNRLVVEVANRLGIKRSDVHFAGTKDKRAVTTQQMAIKAPIEKVQALGIPDVEVKAAFRADFAPKIGDLAGNRFAIRIRGFDGGLPEALLQVQETWNSIEALGGFPNYFGPQRFGSLRPVTHVVGERMLRGDFEGAVMAYVANPLPAESPACYEARTRLAADRDFAAALRYFPPDLSFELDMINYLSRNNGDWIGALRVLPRNLRTMFIYAYQSMLFNHIVSKRMERGLTFGSPLVGDLLAPADRGGRSDVDSLVPVVEENLDRCERSVAAGEGFVTGLLYGYDAPFASGEMGAIERAVAASSGVSKDDFRVPAMPEVRSFGVRRTLLAPVVDFEAEAGRDGAGEYVEVRFALAKGSYATCLLREFMKNDASAN
ncbi:MAG: tRNA pseudouridine(13) synthase TruD [Euryarchaeota archaeon]|nr:tRNA pseudouridine(13) synthase TruD [Euryarchaeota archaeon]